MTKTFYKFSADFEHVLDMCYDTTFSKEEIQTALAQIDSELTEEVSKVRAVIQQLRATVDAYEAEIEALDQYKRAIESRVNFYLETDALNF